MTLNEVIVRLNNGTTIGALARELGIRERDLERKIKNAAIVFDEDKKIWRYMGIAEVESLSRGVKGKIFALEIDRPFISPKEELQHPKPTLNNADYEYRMYKDYLNIDPELQTEKKTFFLSKRVYKTLKHESTRRSLKINVMLNLLLIKGLEHYNIDFVDNNGKEDMCD